MGSWVRGFASGVCPAVESLSIVQGRSADPLWRRWSLVWKFRGFSHVVVCYNSTIGSRYGESLPCCSQVLLTPIWFLVVDVCGLTGISERFVSWPSWRSPDSLYNDRSSGHCCFWGFRLTSPTAMLSLRVGRTKPPARVTTVA